MNWATVKLGDITDVRDGTHDSPKYHDEGYPLVTSKNIKNGTLDLSEVNLISENDFININKRSKVDQGDILMPMIGTIGNPVLIDIKPSFAIKNVCLIKKTKEVNNKYIYYLLKSSLFEETLLNKSRGGTQKFLSLTDIRNFKIPLPPLHIQEQIADTLDKADALRKKDQELLTKYDELAQAIFYDMFGDPVKNEKGWNTGNIEKYFTLINGDRSANYPTNEDFVERGIPFYGTNDMSGIYLSDKVSRFITPQKFNSLSRGKLINGDIVITLRGSLGNTCLFKSDVFETGFINAQMMILRSNKDIIGLFTKYLFQAKTYQELFKKITGGSAVPQITGRQVANLPFIYPPLKTQKLFSQSVIKCLDIQEKTKQNTELQLFETLLTKYFS